MRKYPASAFRDYIKTGELPALPDGDLAIADAVALEGADPELAADLLALHGASSMKPTAVRCPPWVAGHAGFSIKWDGCSHTSGVQRAYVGCAHPGHAACFRYMSVTVQPTRRDVCLHLIAWWYEAVRRNLSREEHQAFRPSQADLDFVAAHFDIDECD